MKPADALPLFTAYYDQGCKSYWIFDANLNYISVNESSLRRHLRAVGYEAETKRDEFISPLDTALNRYQLECGVLFAGPLSGYPKGVIEACGHRILVTSAARLIEPKPGEFPILESILKQLFYDLVTDQRPYVLGWLKVAFESLRAGAHRPGQALVLAGPRDCGKSLFQKIITEILGGRAAKPFRYMSGKTPFNADLFAAEHLMIEDEPGSTDSRARREFGSRIKDLTVNDDQSCHAKNRQALNLRPSWRLSISVNDELENLMILPPMDDSLEDKLMLLKVQRAIMPMPTATNEARAAFWAAIIAELPAFIDHLINWEIPESLRSQRMGITTFHHPDILDAVDEIAPENRMLGLIDAVVFTGGKAHVQVIMTADELEQLLIGSSVGIEARRLFNFSNTCGTYLGRLAKNHPDRVVGHRNAECREWIIKPKS